jgi:hypothetical protein
LAMSSPNSAGDPPSGVSPKSARRERGGRLKTALWNALARHCGCRVSAHSTARSHLRQSFAAPEIPQKSTSARDPNGHVLSDTP